MDSDDDFVSDASSQGDFDGTQGSDDDISLGDGMLNPVATAPGSESKQVYSNRRRV